MKSCLLCLDIESEAVGCIQVNSTKWQTEDVEQLIGKHLWPMDAINSSDWVCESCWHLLDTFHKFYVRIKEAHEILGAKQISKDFHHDELKDIIDCKEESAESSIETEILIEQPPITENIADFENPLFKVETEDISIDVLLKQKRKRGRPPKTAENGQIKKKNDKKILSKIRKTKQSSKSLDVSVKTTLNATQNETDAIKNKSATLDNESTPTLDANENSDYDTEYEAYDEKRHCDTSKKKRKNPDEKTRQEHDKIIAEYFKIFCSLCQISIENFIALRKHFREEHKKRGFVICCKKKIFTRPILVDHIHFHLDPNFFKCKHCDKVYSDRCTLESHVKIHEDVQQDRNHICDTCGKTFVGSTQLETHKLTHAPDYEKKFSCTECGKFFTTLYSLNYHIQAIHHNKYVKICDICGKTMRCRNSFKLHMEKHDSKLAAPIHCDVCGLRLIDRRGLRRHKNSQHPVGGKREYACHICSKISPNPRALRTHVRFAHETGYIHKCKMCEKAFKRPEALKEHVATHTGTPLYSCPWCPKTFISNGNMHNHRKKSHPKEWEEAQRQKYGGIFSCKIEK